MLMAVNTIFEMAATLICVNYLFGKRYYFSIYDAQTVDKVVLGLLS